MIKRVLCYAMLLVGVGQALLAASLAPDAELRAAAEERWGEDIAELEARDQEESHPDDSILFVGSSSIRGWESIVTDMAPYHPIRRGYGGSKFSDVSVFAERLIRPHRFRALVIFVANDVTGKEDDPTAGEVAGWFGTIVDTARKVNPTAPILCMEITPTRSRWGAWPKIREVNRALARECAERSNVHFVPTAKAYLGVDGEPAEDLFVDDQLHQNALGYRIWSAIIKSYLDTVLGGVP